MDFIKLYIRMFFSVLILSNVCINFFEPEGFYIDIT